MASTTVSLTNHLPRHRPTGSGHIGFGGPCAALAPQCRIVPCDSGGLAAGPKSGPVRASTTTGGKIVAKIEGMKPEAGQELYDVAEKVFPDIKAEPGEEAWIFMHTVPYEGSVGLVNLLTATRLGRKGFKVSLVLYGPGVLMASGTRGYPAVGQEAFPGHMAINNQIKTLLSEGATVYACRFAMGALYGFREDDLIPGVTAFNPLDVLDSALTAWRNKAFQLNTWTV